MRVTMYNSYIMKRTQIYLEDDQDRQLELRAGASGLTKSYLIREAVAQYLTRDASEEARLAAFRDAVREAAGSIARLPSGTDYVDEVRRGGRARREELEKRWRSP